MIIYHKTEKRHAPGTLPMKQATLIRPRHRLGHRSPAAAKGGEAGGEAEGGGGAAATTKMCPKRHWLVNKATAAGKGSRRSLDQIVEVLVALILVNCLVATATAALITPPHDLDSIEDEDLSGFYRSPHRLEGYQQQQRNSQNFKISPKPCSFGRVEGTCMFVWECIKSEGRHVGMCVDSFMFGSCCTHNYTDNIVLPQTAFSYTRPTKPLTLRPRPPPPAYKPMISGMTTIERPHGAGTLVIRPSGPHHQGTLARPHPPPYQSKPTTASEMLSAASMHAGSSSSSNSIWHTSTQQQQQQQAQAQAQQQHQQNQQNHWQMTTEPSFITRPRPTGWTKPGIVNLPMSGPRPSKPSKPTKKPIVYERPPPPPPLPPSSTTTSSTTTTIQTQGPTRPQLSAGTSLATSSAYPTFSTSKATTTTTTTTTTRRTTTPAPTTTTTTRRTTSNTRPYQRPTTESSSSTTRSSTTTAKTPTTTRAHPSPSSSSGGIISSSSSSRPTHRPIGGGGGGEGGHIETNEITDSSTHDGAAGGATTALGHVKTISAARSECGVPTLARPETRIVGGKSAAFGRWPWQVSVRRTSFFGFSSTHRCGGALINENWIATAGHCVDDLLISQIRIRVGEYDFSHVQEQLPYIERGVAKKVVHPKYNFFTYEYDLALVKLEQPLEFAPHVSPICLPETESLLIGMNATVTGWGRLSEGGTLPSVLQEVSVPIVSNDNCKSMFLRAGRQEFIPDIFLCAGYETGGQDSCQGDSGGPLQAKSSDGRFFLAGIISWGIGCAEANLPGVCTRISKFVPWILEHVR
ncbi:serine proteinase stubble isoform X2 [Drosophila pseudoobscura]|uniref:Serine proteinase stubble isoform X2 n=2 Tax=Drosophila pseudoobscura pseudoobscura TaxID=46245 RepID=A0A6I8VYY8_DROPS|nr:serine proteinase stubble isoform X2 [Drosophila pseudoobscura]